MAIDEITREILRDHQERCRAPAGPDRVTPAEDGLVFSNDGGIWRSQPVAVLENQSPGC
jgi:hypothetical protein